MAKGDTLRRRKRVFARANESNLLKATYGKALPFAKLPDAAIQDVDKVPASLRRLAQLQAAAEKEEARKAARKEQHEAQLALRAAGHTSPAHQHQMPTDVFQADGRKGQQVPDSQAPGLLSDADAPGPSGRDVPQQQAHREPNTQEQQQQQKPTKKQRHVSSASAAAEERIYKASVFERSKPKKLKDKKKEFLARKKLQKKQGKCAGGVVSGQVMVPAELRLKEKQAATTARFGEVADAPLKVQLKRKHWASQEGAPSDASAGASASRASHRLTEIFQSQLATAQQRLDGVPTRPQAKKQRASSGHTGAPHASRPALDPRLQAQALKAREERERLRQSVVAAYRSSKRGVQPGGDGGAGGGGAAGRGASLASLAKLVERGKGMTEAARMR